MVYISVVWLLPQIFGPSSWMQEQVSQTRFMNSLLSSYIRLVLQNVTSICHFFKNYTYNCNNCFLGSSPGLDYGTVGKELLHQCNSWCFQWEFLGCYVQRFVESHKYCKISLNLWFFRWRWNLKVSAEYISWFMSFLFGVHKPLLNFTICNGLMSFLKMGLVAGLLPLVFFILLWFLDICCSYSLKWFSCILQKIIWTNLTGK